MGGKLGKKTTNLDQKSLRRLQRKVQGELSEDEIQQWYQAYHQRKGDRLMTKAEFTDVYNGLFSGDAIDFAEHVFRTFDLNNDGQIDFNEFLFGICLSGSSNAETKITWAFKVYDIDGDGTITWTEMKNIMQITQQVPNKKSCSSKEMSDDIITVHREDVPSKDIVKHWLYLFKHGRTFVDKDQFLGARIPQLMIPLAGLRLSEDNHL